MEESYEVKGEELKFDGNNPIHFLKWNYTNKDKLNSFKEKIKSKKQYSVSLTGNTSSNVNIAELSGIIPGNKLKEYVQNLLPYSFILQARISLKSPYFSRDDDEFYLIQNPCLKEKVFKVPMIRGSSWKGVIAKAGKDLINETGKGDYFESFVRIFGTGSKEYRELIDSLEKEENNEKLSEYVLNYVLFKLGKKLTKSEVDEIKQEPEGYLKKLSSKFTREGVRDVQFLQVHKGRAIFYPTYFERFALEIINPHDRKKRAGTNPIHYEVVPESSEGTLQIVYMPYDGVLMEKKDVKEEVKRDIEFLVECINKASKNGVGSKTKLGWGQFIINEGVYCLNQEIDDLTLNNWKICEVIDEQSKS